MTAPYLGGHSITAMTWDGAQALRVLFETTYGTTYQYQLYVNRILAGYTLSTSDRSIVANVQPGEWPQHITLLAVDPAEVQTDYGADLPPRPYNQAKLTIDTTGWTDARYIEITAGTEPGGAVDADNVLQKVLFDQVREYPYITDPLRGSGIWNFGAGGVDATEPDGNRGDVDTASVSINAHPRDVEYQEDGTRFAIAVGGGNLTVLFTEAI